VVLLSEVERDAAESRRSDGRRIIFDLTTASRWTGPPTGILRVERELALWALSHRPQTTFAFFDPRVMGYRQVARPYIGELIRGRASVSGWGLQDPTGRRRRRSDAIPPSLHALLQGRRTLLMTLERLRLTTGRSWVRQFADAAQRRLMTDRYRPHMMDESGERRAFLSADMALNEPIDFAERDVLVCVGAGWSDTNIDAIARLKAQTGLRLVVLCHDMIPVQFPEFFEEKDIEQIRAYWERTCVCADLVIATSKAVARDARACASALGAGMDRFAAGDPPPPLEAGRYILCVSTIEPRKGHELLYRAWLELLEAGVPQATGFKLVFAGRLGWKMKGLETALRSDPRLSETLILFSGVADVTLEGLYRNAAFCAYPSIYEGYGLPLVEAFSRGKAVLTSNGGALPELAQGLSPCLDPLDQAAWRDALGSWMKDPAAREAFEAAIAREFRHPTWAQAAEQFFTHVESVVDTPP